ncbi:MAG: hypothetical protein L3J20_07500 [Flavobacteriaceae bacterium]|nr:hypothetical protein [Flavobacteriaceae bacterium]
MKYLYLLFSITLFLSCKGREESSITYFGGQIINPKSDQVFLYKGEQLLDSVKLTSNHKFLFIIDSLALGLYTFIHGPELQYLYLEPTDSLLIRLNTWDFDESLVFSGKGAERNNFLINLFLENEKEDKLFYNFYYLNDSLFSLKIDSVLQRKKILYNQFKEESPENSRLFEKLANVAIGYPLYKKKEAYPYRHKKVTKSKKYPHISPTFYKFRKNIDINDEELINFYPYHDYVKTYLYHLAYEKQVLDDYKGTMDVNFMKATLENLKIDIVKNNFLHQGIWYTLLDERVSKSEKDKAQRLFFDHCSDEKSVAEIALLIKAAEKLPKGQKLPKVSIYNFNDINLSLNSIIKDKNTVLYTWPTDLRQIENLAKRVNYLEKRYSSYLFIGLNSKNSEYRWKKHIKSKKLNADNQYRVDCGIDWLDVNFTRAILVDKNGIVQNNMTHLSSPRFEKHLKSFKNH